MTEDELRRQAIAAAASRPTEELIREMFADSKVAAWHRARLEERMDALEFEVAEFTRLAQRGKGALWLMGVLVMLGGVLVYSRDQVASAAAWVSTIMGSKP